MINRTLQTWLVVLVTAAAASDLAAQDAPAVRTLRLPDGAVQPRIVLDATGGAHVAYLQGDPRASDVFYAKLNDDCTALGVPMRVNSQQRSAVAIGTVRGPDLAIGRNGRVHVIWTGSKGAAPKAPGGHTPVLYARMNDDGTEFEPQRNIIQSRIGWLETSS